MTVPLLRDVPLVLDEGEVPFVIGLGSDARRCVESDGVQFRRGPSACRIEWPVPGSVSVRVEVVEAEGNCYVVAWVGPLLNDWWPLLRQAGPDPTRPMLSRSVAGGTVGFSSGSTTIPVAVVPPGGDVEATAAMCALGGPLDDETLTLGCAVGPAVIKAALLMMGEYRSLVGTVPDIVVEGDAGGSLGLSEVLDLAVAFAAQLGSWTV